MTDRSRNVVAAMPDVVSLTKAAELRKLDRHTLRAAIEAGSVRGHRVDAPGRGKGIGYDVVLRELDEDLAALPRCAYVDAEGRQCERRVFGPSGGCVAHGHVLSGPRAAGVARPDIGPKISAKKMGHLTSPETRAKMAAAKRRYPAERRHCRWCGKQIMPKRNNLDDVSPELLAELGLDLVPGWAIRKGEGNFCRDDDGSHATLWAWTHARNRFPQITEAGRLEWRKAMTALWSGPHGDASSNFREAWKELLSDPVARKKWIPLWQALENLQRRVGGLKGAAKGTEVAQEALHLLDLRPTLEKRNLIDLLIVSTEGKTYVVDDAGRRRAGRDLKYREGRARVVRALRRGYDLLDEPAALTPFV